jgi:hypothetical protein
VVIVTAPVLLFHVATPVVLADTAAVTKAVVASCCVEVPGAAVRLTASPI